MICDTKTFASQNTGKGLPAEWRVVALLRRYGFAVMRNCDGLEKRQDIIVTAAIEIKADCKAAETGNLYVEISSRGTPSGLCTTTAHIWVFDIAEELMLVPTDKLRELARQAPRKNSVDGNVGCLVPLADVRRVALSFPRGGLPVSGDGRRPSCGKHFV